MSAKKSTIVRVSEDKETCVSWTCRGHSLGRLGALAGSVRASIGPDFQGLDFGLTAEEILRDLCYGRDEETRCGADGAGWKVAS